jgi:hypothetical protein
MKWIMSVFSVLMLFSCSQKLVGGGEDVFTRSYVMEYYKPTGIKLSVRQYSNTKNYLIFYFSPSSYVGGYTDEAGTKERELYDALCEKNGDMTFNRKVFISDVSRPPAYMSTNMVSIDVVSNADFDEQHPAGTSLADIISLYGDTAKPYIDSGYTEYKGLNYYPIRKILSEITPDDLILFGDGRFTSVYLHFDSQPTLSKEHTFTLTVIDDEGTTMSDSIEKTFE